MLRKIVLSAMIIAMVSMAAGQAASVSEIQYDDGSDEFRVFFISSQTTESLTTNIPYTEFSSSVDEGTVNQDVQIQVSEQTQEARYPTTALDERQELMPMTYHREQDFATREDATEWAETHCYAGEDGQVGTSIWVSQDLSFTNGLYEHDVYCLTPDESSQYNLASLQSPPDEVFETQWSVQADGEEVESGTVSNAEIGAGQSVALGENVQITWQGNLDTGSNPPNPQNELAAYNNAEGWKIINQDAYKEWRDYVTTESVDRLEKWMNGETNKETLQNEIDSRYEQASTPYSQSPLSQTEVEGGFNNGVFIKNMDQDSIWPSFVLDIDGDYLQVSESVGQPNIVDVSETTVQEGTQEEVEISVRNEGDGRGSFVTRINSCGENFRNSGVSDRKMVEPGEIATFTQYVSFSAGYESDGTVTSSCNIEAEDITSNTVVSQDFEVTGEQSLDCPAGEQDVRQNDQGDDVIYQWSDDCQQQQDIQVCGETDEGTELYAQPEQDGYVCAAEDEPETVDACTVKLAGIELYEDPVCVFTNKWSGGLSDGITTGTAIQTFFALIAAVIGFGLGNRKLPEFANIDDEYTRALLGVAFAALSTLIFYGLWNNILAWIALGVAAVLYIKFGWAIGLVAKIFK